jgi:hypothetical protein
MAKKKVKAPAAPKALRAAPVFKIDIPRAFAIVRSREQSNIALFHLIELKIEAGVVVGTKTSQADLRGVLVPRIEDAILEDA